MDVVVNPKWPRSPSLASPDPSRVPLNWTQDWWSPPSRLVISGVTWRVDCRCSCEIARCWWTAGSGEGAAWEGPAGVGEGGGYRTSGRSSWCLWWKILICGITSSSRHGYWKDGEREEPVKTGDEGELQGGKGGRGRGSRDEGWWCPGTIRVIDDHQLRTR